MMADMRGVIYDNLVAHFGEENVFMDIDNLAPGSDFDEVLMSEVKSCDVLLAVIGKHWSALKGDENLPRLSDPEDFVVLEISTALACKNILVVPILVNGTQMPRADYLPSQLRGLATRQALDLRDRAFRESMRSLIARIEQGRKPTVVKKDVAPLREIAQPRRL